MGANTDPIHIQRNAPEDLSELTFIFDRETFSPVRQKEIVAKALDDLQREAQQTLEVENIGDREDGRWHIHTVTLTDAVSLGRHAFICPPPCAEREAVSEQVAALYSQADQGHRKLRAFVDASGWFMGSACLAAAAYFQAAAAAPGLTAVLGVVSGVLAGAGFNELRRKLKSS